MKVTTRAVSITGWREQQRDAWCACTSGPHHVTLLLDGIGERPTASAAGFRGAAEAIALSTDKRADEIAWTTLVAADAAYRGPLATGPRTSEAELPAAVGAVSVIDTRTGEYAVSVLGDILAFHGGTEGWSRLLNTPHNAACDPERQGSSGALTRFLGDPRGRPPALYAGDLSTGEVSILASDGAIAAVIKDDPPPFWWRTFLESPPSDEECIDNATLLEIKATEGEQ